MKRPLSFALMTVLAACGPTTDPDTGQKVTPRTERDQFGLITCSEANADRTCFTHRSIIGVSMGAHGAGQLGLSRPELFDAIGMLGIPLVDWTYMLRNIQRSYLGGFCDRETIVANMDRMNDPAGPAFCGPVIGTEKMEPSGKILEPAQDFNHWYRWIDTGRGGSFGRNKLRESLQDISLAFGNAMYFNPQSPYYPPGVPLDYRGRPDSEVCTRATVIQGMKHKEFNPDGAYDVIAFCDTRTNEGEFDPARPAEEATEILLAVDYNQNGRRDYAEPIITMLHERFEDVGGGANDKYDPHTNPTGKAENWLWDEGEPYEDFGLDGVDATGDFGEGNGQFDYNPNVLNYMALNPRRLLETMPDGHLARLNLWADAGIRDFLYSAGGTNWFWGALQARLGKGAAKDWTSFGSLLPAGADYDFLEVDYTPSGIGQHAYVRYGDPNASERDIMRGDGHHVGSGEQILQRFLTAMHFIQARFYERHVEAIPEVENLGDLIQARTFRSEALGRDRKFGIVTPPGYEDPKNADVRYPVMYFLHGQGQESTDLLASAVIFFGYMAGSSKEDTIRREQSDWAKFILVFPDSTCDADACSSGNFNTNHKGLDGNGPKYMDSLFELMAHVEANYRTAVPIEVEK